MRSLTYLTALLATAACAALPLHAQQPAPAPAVKAPAKEKGLGLKDGDRFIFIGDSITHQCLYTQYVEDFFYTRYPKMRIHFRNAGVSGDRAADALDRFDDDIASFKPTVATVLLGMNDGSYRDFDQATFDTYAAGMQKLCDRLDAIKCRVILMSPTMFDHQAFEQMVAKDPAKAKNKTPTNYNGVLAYYGKWAQEVARKRGYQFVDLYGPLNTYTTQQRQLDPNYTLIADAIHPGPDGQLVMAYEVLRQTGELGGIFSNGVKVISGAWQALRPAGGEISDVAGEPGKFVSYTATLKCLPWIVPADAAAGYKLTRAGHTGTQESHIVGGLNTGRYDLVINGKNVQTFDERMMSTHAEIEDDADSPTHQQALAVAELNKKRNAEAINPLRNLYGQRKGKLRAAREKNDMAGFDTWINTELKPKEAELLSKAAALEDEIYKLNQPQPLKVEVKPTTTPAPGAGKGKGKGNANGKAKGKKAA